MCVDNWHVGGEFHWELHEGTTLALRADADFVFHMTNKWTTPPCSIEH